jgi:hypothetical protein
VEIIKADEEADAGEDNYLPWPSHPDFNKFCPKCCELVDRGY